MPDETTASAPPERLGRTICFGPFHLHPAQQLLLNGDEPVHLGSRALAILLALVERSGQVVGKDELLAAAWPNMVVEEVNLRVHVAALRRAIGDGQGGNRYLATIPGRGYQFVSPITVLDDDGPAPPAPPTPQPRTVPLPLGRIVGRSEFISAIQAQLAQRRLVTVVGPGGIGKTTVAVAVADELLRSYPDGVHFVDLAAVPHAGLVGSAVASVLGVSSFSDDPFPSLIASLREKRLLLILDSCERVVDGAAALVEQVLKAAPRVHILTTSREPLRAEGERVLRLPPLAMPPVAAVLSAEQALTYPAVQLFAERAAAILEGFTLTDADAPVMAEICARLDGIALAIELAAGHVTAFDLRSLATLLEGRFRLLAKGRRTALPRHQTMRAALDWSYDSLPEPERLVLRRLAVFEGAIALPAIRAVAADAETDGNQITESLANLIDRSLVTAEISDAGTQYRLLDTTRAYARERLAQSGEHDVVARRLAEYCLETFARAEATWAENTTTAWIATHSRLIGHVRVALDWAFAPGGDTALGVALSAATVPLLFELSSAEECRRRAAQALAAMADGGRADRRMEMRLRATLGAAMMYTPGPVAETTATWEAVLAIAIEFGDQMSEARALWGLWTACIYGGMPRAALAFAERFHRLSVTQHDATARSLLGERAIGVSLHYMGQQQAARDCLQAMIDHYSPAVHRWQTLGFQIDHGMMARATLARILWLQGFPDQAVAMTAQAVEAARRQGHAISFCYVLFEAALPVALLVGDLDAATQALDTLQELAVQNGLAIWQSGAACMRLAIRFAQGQTIPTPQLHAALQGLSATGYTAHSAWLTSIFATACGAQGATAAGQALADKALSECDKSAENWCVPELLRIKAELLMQDPLTPRKTAEALLHQAQDLARKQGARSWEQRIATSLSSLSQRLAR
jgi:predicted ATPase/DNA-binding winged helix-turn-helix (wHTH) protein